LTGYEDAPQWRSIEPHTLGLLGFKAQPSLRGEISLEEEKIIKAIIKPEFKPAQGVPAEQCTLSFFRLEIQKGRAATTHEN
jgi:hypothetical protein